MGHIKASEDSFGRANNYYILMWVMTALIVVAAFLDFRTHRLEESANQQIIDFYEPMRRVWRESCGLLQILRPTLPGRVPSLCHPKCSFRPLSARRRPGFSSRGLSADAVDCRSH